MNRVYFTDRDLGKKFPAILAAAGLDAPFIAKVYRATPADLVKNPNAQGAISLWYPKS